MPDWDQTVDTVVVGSGGGALVAALVARERGLEVLVLEKTELIGGSTAMSGGGVFVPDNHVIKAKGIADSPEQSLRYLESTVGDVGPGSSPARKRAFVENAPKMARFLADEGVELFHQDGWSDYYDDRPGGVGRGRTLEVKPYDKKRLGPWRSKLRPGMTAAFGVVSTTYELVPLSYWNRSVKNMVTGARVLARTALGKVRGQDLTASGNALMGSLLELSVARGVQLWTEAAVTDLVVDGGRVVGVVAMRNGRPQRIRARAGVLLAAGGYSRNRELRERFSGPKSAATDWTAANPGDTGEVLELALALGAGADFLDEAIWNPGTLMPDGSRPPYPMRETANISRARYRPGSIMVDANGDRIWNESGSYMELGQRMFERDQTVRAVPSWLILDDAFRSRYFFGWIPGKIPQRWFDDGFCLKSDTLEELAERCGIDPGGLAATVARWNGFAARGVDEDFGRGGRDYDVFHGDPRMRPNHSIAPIAKPPYYAFAMFPGDVGTFGGMLTDEHARVVRDDGSVIPGLWATGNITASVMGRHYPGAGASIGASCTFGYIAMHDIADGAAVVAS